MALFRIVSHSESVELCKGSDRPISFSFWRWPRVHSDDPDHSEDEERFILLGLSFKLDGLVKSPLLVTPAKAGVQKRLKRLDSRLRGNDRKERFPTSYESIKLCLLVVSHPYSEADLTIRILSARKANSSEKEQYWER